MKAHTNDFKLESKKFGKQINAEINYGSEAIPKKEINSLKFVFNTELFKTIMKQVTFDTNIEVPEKTWVNPKFGYKVGNSYEMLDYGSYYINKEPEYNVDNKAYTHIAYDSMIESMVLYDDDPLEISYPISYKNMLMAIAGKLGWTFTQTGFTNESTMIEYDLYSGLGLTYRDILDDLCPASMGNITVTDSKEMKIIYPTETGDTIDKTYLDEDNINIGEKIGPVNSLVLTRAEGGDSLYRKDQDSIDVDGLHEIKISDNLLLSSAFRESFIDEMFDKIKGFEYYEIDLNTGGLAYYDLLDRFTINLDGNSYSTVVLNCDLNIESGVEEILYSPPLDEAVTDYTTSGMTDKGQKFANIITYKNQAKIELLAGEINDLTDYVRDISNSGSYIGLIKTPNSQGAINKLRIRKFELMPLYPGMAYPSEYTYPGVLNFYTLIFDTVNTFDDNPHYVYINSPVPLDKIGDIYDELLIEANKIKVIQRIGYNGTTKIVLSNPIIHDLGDTLLPTFDGDTFIRVKYFDDLMFEAEYLIKNELTSNFATQIESSAQFNITSNSINQKVSKNEIIAEINLTPGEAKINASKIKLNGYVSNDAGSFEITPEGYAKFHEAEITGGNFYLPSGGKVIGGDGLLTNLQATSGNFQQLGYYYNQFSHVFTKTPLELKVNIPEKFTITEAFVLFEHAPIRWFADFTSQDGWGYAKKIKLYNVNTESSFYPTAYVSSEFFPPSATTSDIDKAFGVDGFTTSEPSAGVLEVVTSIDIKDNLKHGTNLLLVQPEGELEPVSGEMPEVTAIKNTSYCTATLNIVGYMSYENNE